MGRNNGTYEMDTTPSDIARVQDENRALEKRVAKLEADLELVVKYLRKQRKNGKKR